MTNEEMKKWIDNASYEELFEKWRNEGSGSPWFEGELGTYYSKVMSKMRKKVGENEHVRISKKIGWNGRRGE